MGWRLTAALFALFATAAVAHPAHAPDAAWAWNREPALVALLGASAALYAAGVARLWRKAGRGRGITRADTARFAAGWIALGVALLSPVDAMGAALFSVHMVQHELLMVVAAPLLVLGRPLEAWAWGLPARASRALAGIGQRRALKRTWSLLSEPASAWALHALALWLWHIPALFQAALASEAVHVLQHSSFLASGLLFWWSVFGGASRRAGGASLASLFTTMVHTGALGALLTFSPGVWYPHYAQSDPFGRGALEDQQLGGLVMWVPAGAAYLAAALALVAGWIARDARARSP
jgi:putative membrane protein